MLEGLDQIDWKGIGEPKVPEWLRGIAQGDADALDKFRDHFFNLGQDIPENYGPPSELLKNDAPILIVPFLIELLRCEACKRKTWIFNLLLDFDAVVDLTDATALISNKMSRDDASLILQDLPEDDIYTTRARQLFRAVYEGRELYKTFLHGYSPAIGFDSALLLDTLGELD